MAKGQVPAGTGGEELRSQEEDAANRVHLLRPSYLRLRSRRHPQPRRPYLLKIEQHKCARAITGCLRLTNSKALLTEADLPSLSTRAKQLKPDRHRGEPFQEASRGRPDSPGFRERAQTQAGVPRARSVAEGPC